MASPAGPHRAAFEPPAHPPNGAGPWAERTGWITQGADRIEAALGGPIAARGGVVGYTSRDTIAMSLAAVPEDRRQGS